MAYFRSDGLQTKLVTIALQTLLVRRGGGEAISLGVPVEHGVTALKIYIEGAVEHAVLYPPNEGIYHKIIKTLLNQ
jgi:hypothetical protein